MTTRITAIYDNPSDTAAFEADWANVPSLAGKLPGIQRVETGKAWPKEDGSATPAYRILDLYFDSYEAASAAVTTAEAGDLFGVLVPLGSAGVKFIFFDVDNG